MIPNKLYKEFKALGNSKNVYLYFTFNNKSEGGVNLDLKPTFTNFQEFPKIKDESLLDEKVAKHASIQRLKED